MKKIIILLLNCAFILSAPALPNFNKVDPFFGDNAINLESTNFVLTNQNYNFEGIVGLSNCSGSLVRVRGADLSKKALVMTNGHCVGMGSARAMGSRFPAPGEVLTNIKVNRTMRLFSTGPRSVARVKAIKLLYATMTDTDLALYELNETYEEIKQEHNIDAFILSETKPLAGTPIEVISGYWRRGYSCRMDSEIFQLKEGAWLFRESIKYTQPGCETIGGTSGSPIINANTREIVGVNNTGNEDSGKACTIMNPCEVDQSGTVTDDDHQSYGQQSVYIYTCLNSEKDLDLSVNDCKLPR